jgi:alkylhydroperoxidase/carboxymuconolactone decarboxylase family protein YurZ
MLSQKNQKAFQSFYKAAGDNSALDARSRALVSLATSMALGCYPWIRHYLGVAREQGLTDEEIGAIEMHVMTVAAGKIKAQVSDVLSKWLLEISATNITGLILLILRQFCIWYSGPGFGLRGLSWAEERRSGGNHDDIEGS